MVSFFSSIFGSAEEVVAVPVRQEGQNGWTELQTTAATRLIKVASGNYNAETKRLHVGRLATNFKWGLLVEHKDWTSIRQLLNLVQYGLPINAADAYMILMHAVNSDKPSTDASNPKSDQLQIVEALCDLQIEGLNLDKKDEREQTAFGIAMRKDNGAMAEVLKDNGATVGVTGYLFAARIINREQVGQIDEIVKQWSKEIKAVVNQRNLLIAKGAFMTAATILPTAVSTTITGLAVRAFCLLMWTPFYFATWFIPIPVPAFVTTLSVPATLSVAAYVFNPMKHLVPTAQTLDPSKWKIKDIPFAIGKVITTVRVAEQVFAGLYAAPYLWIPVGIAAYSLYESMQPVVREVRPDQADPVIDPDAAVEIDFDN